VHNSLGRYCNEKQYSDAFEHLLIEKRIKYEREKYIPISFEGEKQGRNKVDFIVNDRLIVELKSKRTLLKEDYYQVKRYLISFKKQLGLLVNFRDKFLKPRRILNSQT
ncbi:GxxExxY protein, partial [Candidatus Roizmanbacteria bacterium CG_4_9_14_0_2_um_filter_35_15]